MLNARPFRTASRFNVAEPMAMLKLQFTLIDLERSPENPVGFPSVLRAHSQPLGNYEDIRRNALFIKTLHPVSLQRRLQALTEF
jgi:hypothetical protein